MKPVPGAEAVGLLVLAALCLLVPPPVPAGDPPGGGRFFVSDQPLAIGWDSNAVSLRGQNGRRFTFACPPNGVPKSVWGTDLYTDDSSICTAAVHAGALNQFDGGTVTIEIRPGQGGYMGSTKNGIQSGNYGPYAGSYVIVAAAPGPPAPPPALGATSWDTTATPLRGRNGRRFTFACPPNGAQGSLWGTDVYTDDSSICTAAVHAGLITKAGGGTVTIEIRPGQGSYMGSTKNGIQSGNYGPYGGSYVFVTGAAPPPLPQGRSYTAQPRMEVPPGSIAITWVLNATGYRGHNGERYRLTCPAGGTLGPVWGTDLYTDDSSICSAAVHAGLITVAFGGTVTIEIRPGQPHYMGTGRNGVVSGAYGPWTGSFIFVLR
jgi:hypothetical protein